MFILVEKFTNTYESQACELIATVDEAQNQIYVSVYGVTYTGTNPIATFDGQYSLATNNFEITATPVSGVDTLNVRVQTTELNGTD